MTYKEKFLIEKREKNKAYCFILKYGLLGQFAEFCRDNKTADPFEGCISHIVSHE